MAANIPDLGAVSHLGGQFHHNVFQPIQKGAHNASKKFEAAHVQQVKQTAQNRERFAQSAAQGIKTGQAAFAKQKLAQVKSAQAAAKAHAAGVKSGRVAPTPGAPPRTFAIGSTPQQKAAASAAAKNQATQARTMKQQVNFAHGEALKFQAAQFKVKQQQVNSAHGEAIRESTARAKAAGKAPAPSAPSTPKVPSLTPSFSNPSQGHQPIKPQGIPATTFSNQFQPQKSPTSPQGSAGATFSHGASSPTPKAPAAPQGRSGSVTGPQFNAPKPVPQMPAPATKRADVSTKDNSPYPTHMHPEGSSNAVLPKLTAAQPKPNTFTVGSRAAKPNGIAARGSQLEAWAIGRQQEVRKARGSNNTQLRIGDSD